MYDFRKKHFMEEHTLSMGQYCSNIGKISNSDAGNRQLTEVYELDEI